MFARTNPHILPVLLAIILSIGSVITTGCGNREKPSTETLAHTRFLKERGLKALNDREFPKASLIADTLLQLAGKDAGNTEAEIYGKIIKGQSIMYTDSFAACYPILHDAVALCVRQGNDSALASAYNGLGIYSIDIEKDNEEALRNFFLGIEAAKRSGNEHLHSLLLSNVTSVYYIARNPEGLCYGQECLDRGKSRNEPYLRCVGGMTVAFSHMASENYDKALADIKEAEAVMLEHEIKEGSTLYGLYGMILHRMGRNEEAAEAFRKSIGFYETGADEIGDIRSFTELGEILAQEGRYDEAIKTLEAGLKYNDLGTEVTYRGELLEALSRVNGLAGNPAKAREYENLRQAERMAILNHEREIANKQLRAKYDLERVENENNLQRVEILEKRNQIYTLALVAGIGLCLLISILILYRNKSRLYSAIVRQMTDSVREESRLRDTIRHLETDIQALQARLQTETDRHEMEPAPANDSVNLIPNKKQGQDPEDTQVVTGMSQDSKPELSGSGEPSEVSEQSEAAEDSAQEGGSIPPQLYRRLQTEMDRLLSDPAIFTDNLLNNDRLAKKLGTNRTYLSRFVNAHYKMTFTQLINSLRIKEAIRILSDPESDIPLKNIAEHVGYSSHTTFYAKFSEATGMTPAAFRAHARNLPAR